MTIKRQRYENNEMAYPSPEMYHILSYDIWMVPYKMYCVPIYMEFFCWSVSLDFAINMLQQSFHKGPVNPHCSIGLMHLVYWSIDFRFGWLGLNAQFEFVYWPQIHKWTYAWEDGQTGSDCSQYTGMKASNQQAYRF